MCGRFFLTMPAEELIGYLEEELGMDIEVPTYSLSYNIAPTQKIVTVSPSSVSLLTWGLTPAWSKHPLINARAESLFEKATFRSLLSSRCLIPASGYIEWQGKQPFVFVGTMFFAGLIEDGKCVIVTTAARADLAKYHDRMPAILDIDSQKKWLFSDDEKEAWSVLVPSDVRMDVYPVSKEINSVKNNNADLLSKTPAGQKTLM